MRMRRNVCCTECLSRQLDATHLGILALALVTEFRLTLSDEAQMVFAVTRGESYGASQMICQL
jgi:hypothetical protein